jgi:hypothetical protein
VERQSRLLQLDTTSIQVIPTSIHPGSASTQFQRLLVRRQQYGPRQPYDQGQKKLLLPHFSISDLLAPYRCNTVFWASSYTNIFSATRGLHKNVQRDSRVQPRDRKYLPTHHSTSRRIAGPIKATPMSWLPYTVTDVTPHLRMGMYLYYCFTSKHYHKYRANCLAVVGVITGVRIERHKLQSQHWRRDVV